MTFWVILALIITFLHFPNKNPINSMYMLGMVIIGVGIIGSRVFKINKPLGIGVFCVLASYLTALGTPLTLTAFHIMVFFIMWVMLYLAVLQTKERPIFWALGIAGTVSAIYLLIQRLGFDPVFSHLDVVPRYSVYGFLGSIGNTACFQAICLPIAVFINPILGICTFAGLVMTGNAVGIVAGTVGLGYYFWVKKSWKLLIVMALIVLSGIIFLDKPTKADVGQRWRNVYHTMRYIKKGEITVQKKSVSYQRGYSLFGYGLGSFKSSMPYIPPEDIDNAFNRGQLDYLSHPHSEPFLILYNMGPIALIVSIWILLRALRTRNIAIKGSILAFTVCSFGYFPLTIIPVTVQLAILLGLTDKKNKIYQLRRI